MKFNIMEIVIAIAAVIVGIMIAKKLNLM